jgi:hypothetical protein
MHAACGLPPGIEVFFSSQADCKTINKGKQTTLSLSRGRYGGFVMRGFKTVHYKGEEHGK